MKNYWLKFRQTNRKTTTLSQRKAAAEAQKNVAETAKAEAAKKQAAADKQAQACG